MSYTSVVHCLGWAVMLLAALMILPALTALLDGDTALAWTFLASSVLSGFCGAGFALSTWHGVGDFGKREGFMFLVLIWLVLALFGAIPLHFSGLPGRPIDAFFEAISGLTTTGATVFEGLETMPPAILLWRALLQWAGGLLSVVLAVSLISHLGIGGMEAYQSALPRGEGANLPTRMLQTAQDLFWIYVLLTLFGAVALWATGMSAFDGLCHAFAALSTGGFSTRDGGIASFDNPAIELVLMAIMLLGAMNFTLHWAAFNGRFRAFRENAEIIYLTLTVTVLVFGVIILVLLEEADQGFIGPFRTGVFTAISALTTTGFSNADMAPGGGAAMVLAPILIVGLALVGGASGSTTGGMRLMRVAVLFKQAQRELLRLSHPHGIRLLRLGKVRVENPVVWSVWSFFFLLILVLAAVALALAFFGLAPEAAVAAAVLSISNAGPFLQAVAPGAPSYADMPDGAKLVLSFAMLAGRVELLALLSLMNPAYWRR
ncbi:MAG: TrkH family potassium uptake protein [Rhodospirillaceae bacterium]|nr:TrkH family potassium uptake protein [Rhodospirillaceae bacterium]